MKAITNIYLYDAQGVEMLKLPILQNGELNKELEIAPIEHKPLVEDMLERDTIMIKPVE